MDQWIFSLGEEPMTEASQRRLLLDWKIALLYG
jgi:hypothetical protein